jgi:mannobiose 2-epimerase
MFRCCLILLMLAVSYHTLAQTNNSADRKKIADEIENSVRKELLDVWYPRCIDRQYGGFLTGFTFDFKPTGDQDKMIVSQARHTWTNAKAAIRYPDRAYYRTGALLGFRFLRDVMWDKNYGGFYQLVDRQGNVKGGDQKTAYGNSFALYALAAYYQQSKDTAALRLAKEAFLWLEKHSHDPVHKGYFQHLERNGTPVKRNTSTPSTSDLGYKDQNSSIHLLEAFTELYQIWPDPLVKERVQEMLLLIRDKIVSPKGNLVLFFKPDWSPVSFADSNEAVILRHRYIDHVSFGHDVETAYLLIEAAHVIHLDDPKTLIIAKKMVDHSLQNGWDDSLGGFYDQGYYFKSKPGMSIIDAGKNWWTQSEALNTLLLMADQFPDDKLAYYNQFKKLWKYCQTYLIDHEYGDWYEEGLDHDPQRKTANKGHIWKATYHQYRALTGCIDRLRK